MEDNKAKKKLRGSYGDGVILYKVVKNGSAEKMTHDYRSEDSEGARQISQGRASQTEASSFRGKKRTGLDGETVGTK